MRSHHTLSKDLVLIWLATVTVLAREACRTGSRSRPWTIGNCSGHIKTIPCPDLGVASGARRARKSLGILEVVTVLQRDPIPSFGVPAECTLVICCAL